jgi:hypothetical protein
LVYGTGQELRPTATLNSVSTGNPRGSSRVDSYVLSGGVYDDSCSFDSLACGKAYYDLLTVENRTLTNKEDTVQGPTQ